MKVKSATVINRITGIVLLAIFAFCGCDRENEKPLVFTPIDLNKFSRDHKGFNLLGKYDAGWSNSGFREEEFIIIKDLGFNFARLPLDYRTYTLSGNWDIFLEEEVAEIDRALDWGREYGVHICIDLHRAPGYCVNPGTLPANQDLDLWTDREAQEAFINHWEYFAERYKNVSYKDLSFNLLNEPKNMDENTYLTVIQKAIDKIQALNPDRIIFVDGLNYSREIIPSLKNNKNIIQALHVYDPMTLTHYRASWVEASDTWPLPVWPMADIPVYLYGPWQSDSRSSLVLEGNFRKDTKLTINVQQVSNRSTLKMMLNGSEIYSKVFICTSDPGEDWTKILNTQWGYQNISGKDYSVILPSDGTRLTLSNTEGDWLSFNRITFSYGNDEIVIIPGNTSWGAKQRTYQLTSDGKVTDEDGNPLVALGSIIANLELARQENIPVMIQEFGVYNLTPHDVATAYLTDVVSVFKTHQTGYAMWNMIGSMGIINSDRADCNYEQYMGKLLDREMTTIVQGN